MVTIGLACSRLWCAICIWYSLEPIVPNNWVIPFVFLTQYFWGHLGKHITQALNEVSDYSNPSYFWTYRLKFAVRLSNTNLSVWMAVLFLISLVIFLLDSLVLLGSVYCVNYWIPVVCILVVSSHFTKSLQLIASNDWSHLMIIDLVTTFAFCLS